MDERQAVTIIGAGPAGMAAAIHLQRAGLAPLLLERNVFGGLLRYGYWIENYPGFPEGIKGDKLAALFHHHLLSVGGKVTSATVQRVDRDTDHTFTVTTSQGTVQSDAVIVATGTRPCTIDIPGLRGLEGISAFYDLFELYKVAGGHDRILVYGGGDAAFDQAIRLNDEGHEVTIQCRSVPRCLPLLRERASMRGIPLVEHMPIVGARMGYNGTVLDMGREGSMIVDKVLLACGREPRVEILSQELLPQNNASPPASSVPGLFLAGDVVGGTERQVGIAIGSGISSAMKAEKYVDGR